MCKLSRYFVSLCTKNIFTPDKENDVKRKFLQFNKFACEMSLQNKDSEFV